jgi:RNA polymerase sigma factor (sigma-70 family)
MPVTDFATLADPYRPELLAYCYRMLGSVDEAEDQVQETLLRAWRAFGDFEGRASLRTWLYRIATNTCLRALETRSKRPLPSGLGAPAEDPDGVLLDRYAAAFQAADVAGLTALLRKDATIEMPPQPYWFAGRDQVSRFLASRVLTAPGLFVLVPTSANGQPAFGTYMRADDGTYAAHGIQLLSVDGQHVTRIVSFNDDTLLAMFGLPHSQPAAGGLAVIRS